MYTIKQYGPLKDVYVPQLKAPIMRIGYDKVSFYQENIQVYTEDVMQEIRACLKDEFAIELLMVYKLISAIAYSEEQPLAKYGRDALTDVARYINFGSIYNFDAEEYFKCGLIKKL